MSTTREDGAGGTDAVDVARYVSFEMDDSVVVYDRETDGGWVHSTVFVALREVR